MGIARQRISAGGLCQPGRGFGSWPDARSSAGLAEAAAVFQAAGHVGDLGASGGGAGRSDG